MGRRRPPPPDSLELLLDTLCNTFGGVLFIGILVVLLMNLAGDREAADPEAAAEEVRARREEFEVVQAEVAGLRELVRTREAAVDPNADRRIKDLTSRVAALAAERDRIVGQGEAVVAETAQTAETAARNEASARSLEKTLDEARRANQAAREALEKARRDDAAKAGGGLLHSTTKKPIALIVRYGRLYVWHRYDRSNRRTGLNTDEFFVAEETEEGYTTVPKRDAGLPLGRGKSDRGAVESRLKRFPPAFYYLEVVLNADSFDVFQDFKSTLIALGYEYRLIVKRDGDPVEDRGGKDAKVQ